MVSWSCEAVLLRSCFGVGVLLWVCCIFSECPFLRGPLESCFCLFLSLVNIYIILFKSCEINYLPSITSDQLHTFLTSDSPVNYAFSFLAVPCLYYVICLLSLRPPNAQMQGQCQSEIKMKIFLLYGPLWLNNKVI